MKKIFLVLVLLASCFGFAIANDIVGTVTPVTRSSDAVSNITINGITQSVTWLDLPTASSYNVYSAVLSTTSATSTANIT